MPFGQVDFTGDAPAHSAIQILGDDELIAEASADASGKWKVKTVYMPVGSHTIRATATRSDGEIFESPPIVVEVKGELEASGDDSSLSLSEELELLKLRREFKERADRNYADLVMAVADGFDVDDAAAECVLAGAEKTLDDFQRDLHATTAASAARELKDIAYAEQIEALRNQCNDRHFKWY